MEENKHYELTLRIERAIAALDELDEYMEQIPQMQQDIDFRLSDVAHFIEYNGEKLKQKGARKLIEMFSKDRKTRKIINIEKDIKNAYRSNINKLLSTNSRKFLIRDIYKAEENWNNDYSYRVYNEKDLKDLSK